jgi:hypothetical protein
MKKYICDTCESETEILKFDELTRSDIPSRWISIKIAGYYNDSNSDDKQLLRAGNVGEQHFCCKDCFIKYFFKIS